MTPEIVLRSTDDYLRAADFAAARRCLVDGIALWSDNTALHWKYANLLAREGHLAEALDALCRLLEIDDSNPDYWAAFSSMLAARRTAQIAPGLIRILTKALKVDGIDVAGVAAAAQSVLWAIFNGDGPTPGPAAAWDIPNISAASAKGLALQMLIAFLEHGQTTSRGFELVFTQLRRRLTSDIGRPLISPKSSLHLDLISALALHAFHHEYVFAESAEESAHVAFLQNAIVEGLAKGIVPAPLVVAAVAAYRPLHREPFSMHIGNAAREVQSQLFAKLVEVQIEEPLEELAIKSSITCITPIADAVSQVVRAQYEENPYPRWNRLPVSRNREATDGFRRVLVAGAGTGRHPLIIALSSPASEIWAVDISRASLAYGIRKSRKLGVENVKFFQGDILELGSIGTTFDSISCVGVLHHLEDPGKGLRILSRLLKSDGSLEIGLYTESGRAAVVAGIALRNELGLVGTMAGIRKFRQAVFAQSNDAPTAGLATFRDFYSLSECRDLVFHVQEHRFTLPKAVALFAASGLKVIRIRRSAEAEKLFRSRFPDADPATCMESWTALEMDHPGLFGSMYNFVLSKI
jgi:ubiquinone/menaquinone biosynthesis C-methylase UbiE